MVHLKLQVNLNNYCTVEKNAQLPRKVCFYISAHADDWNLFMYPHVYNDIVSGCKTVLIFTTAGDAGFDQRFWLSREEAAISAIKFCMLPLCDIEEEHDETDFNGHLIHWHRINNIVVYFLRLPDGGMDGKGHKSGQYQSLEKLICGEIESIVTLNNTATYYTWNDLVNTMEAIISIESDDSPEKYLHYLNPDIAINFKDHPDHIATGRAVQNIRSANNFHHFLYTGYSNSNSKNYLAPEEIYYKSGMLAVYEKTMYDCCGYSTIKEKPELYCHWCCVKPVFTEIPAMHNANASAILRSSS